MFAETCVEIKLVGCTGASNVFVAVQMFAVILLVVISAEDARLCGERVL